MSDDYLRPNFNTTPLRADFVALGIRLGWAAADEKEELAVDAVMERLRHEGEGILLIFDNALGADALKPYLPRGGAARVLVTSNAHTWRGVAEMVEIRLWPKEIGADYLIARTGREAEHAAAELLSEVLGGLPLALEQAGAYCERLDVSLVDYRKRFEAAPARLLDDERDAPVEYHDRLTVAKTFALAIEEAANLNPAAEPLIVHAALLAPEPIPLFLFYDAREQFGEPLATALVDDGLDEAVAALRAFALVDREPIVDERDVAIATDAIHLHRLVREVAASRYDSAQRDAAGRALLAVLVAIYPRDSYRNPASWPRCAVLTPHLISSCETETADVAESAQRADLLNRAGSYFHGRAAYSAAEPLLRRALAIREKALGPEHPDTATGLTTSPPCCGTGATWRRRGPSTSTIFCTAPAFCSGSMPVMPMARPATGPAAVPRLSQWSRSGSTRENSTAAIRRPFRASCSQQGRGICNGNRIDDRDRCINTDCSLYSICDRNVLHIV